MKLHEKIENGKRQLANQLNSVSERYSTTTKKGVLLIAGLVFASICVSMIVAPFQRASTIKLKDDTPMPVVISPPMQEPWLSERDYKMMKGFIETMDSLKRFDKNTYQDAMKGREGLIDSILFLLRHAGETLIQK